MKWIELNLARVSEIEKQVEEVLRTYDTLLKQHQSPRRPGNFAQIERALQVLRSAMTARVAELEAFYRENDLDARAARLEGSRLKLKRILRESNANVPTTAAAKAAPSARSDNSRPESSTPSRPVSTSHQHSQQYQQQQPEQGTVTLRVLMTRTEYDELQVRRDAARHIMRKGEGAMSWEAPRRPTADPGGQGMYTAHEIPFDDRAKPAAGTAAARGEARDGVLRGGASPRAPHNDFVTSRGAFVSSSEKAHSGRFPSARDERSGGLKAVDTGRPFNAVTGRTNAASALTKVQPLGTQRYV
jgi:hypothetical protein